MTFDHLRPLLVDATERLLATVLKLDAPQDTPSGLPEWSQAHLLTHLARNADAMRNLALAARSGVFVGMYASFDIRQADIAHGAAKSLELLEVDLRVASKRLLIELDTMPSAAWDADVAMMSTPDSVVLSAARIPLFRLGEVELHHVDLAAGHELSATPQQTLDALITLIHARLSRLTPAFVAEPAEAGTALVFGGDDATGPVVRGSTASLLAWLTGRTAGADLSVDPGHQLPIIPPF